MVLKAFSDSRNQMMVLNLMFVAHSGMRADFIRYRKIGNIAIPFTTSMQKRCSTTFGNSRTHTQIASHRLEMKLHLGKKL